MTEQKQIEELFKDLCEAPTGGANEDFTIGTLKESHTDLFIRTVARHLVSLNYHKQSEGEWIYQEYSGGHYVGKCNVCECEADMTNYCPHCGAKMKGR